MLVGVIGGGQLGRMLGLAGIPLGLHFRFLDPSRDAPAREVGAHHVGAYDDRNLLGTLAERAAVVTFEFENVPVEAAEWLAETVPVWPPPAALAVAQDRLEEKRLFRRLGIGTAPIDDEVTRFPALLKTRRLGYDGKGQERVETRPVPGTGRVLEESVLEEIVPFERELSILAVRGTTGETAFYPLVENVHEDGILRVSRAPARPELQQDAERIAMLLLDELGYVGVLAVELFEVEGRLLANELAPRVHNSGHWTIEGAETSQFENHLRAILGLPLGSTAARDEAVMVNLIGTMPPTAEVLAITGAHLHDYGKQPRPGRKLGHVTIVDPADGQVEELLALARRPASS